MAYSPCVEKGRPAALVLQRSSGLACTSCRYFLQNIQAFLVRSVTAIYTSLPVAFEPLTTLKYFHFRFLT